MLILFWVGDDPFIRAIFTDNTIVFRGDNAFHQSIDMRAHVIYTIRTIGGHLKH